DDPPQARMHAEIARRRLYLHPHRWTSLGLSLLEAMSCAMPVVVPATTESVMAVPRAAARRFGALARTAAQTSYGLPRFLSDWDAVLEGVASGRDCGWPWSPNTLARWRCLAESTRVDRIPTSRSWRPRSPSAVTRSACTPVATTPVCPRWSRSVTACMSSM